MPYRFSPRYVIFINFDLLTFSVCLMYEFPKAMNVTEFVCLLTTIPLKSNLTARSLVLHLLGWQHGCSIRSGMSSLMNETSGINCGKKFQL